MDVNYDAIENCRKSKHDSYGSLAKLVNMHESGLRKGLQNKSLNYASAKILMDYYKECIEGTNPVDRNSNYSVDRELQHALEKIKYLEDHIKTLKELLKQKAVG